MKKLIVSFVMLFCVTLLGGQALAHDLRPPGWRGTANTLMAEWDTGWDTGFPYYADSYTYMPDNNMGVPYVEGRWESNYSGDTAYVHYGTLDIWADNFNNNNPLKMARLQITYLTNGVTDFDVKAEAGGVTYQGSLIETIIGANTETQIWDFIIRPNPDEEWFHLTFDTNIGIGQIHIDQIVLDTICTPVPGAILLFGSGVIGLAGFRRKKG